VVEKQEKKKEISGGRDNLSFLSFRVSSSGNESNSANRKRKKKSQACTAVS
jgi:hypothetical protein